MQISITGRHLDLSEALKNYIETKLKQINHNFNHVVNINVTLDLNNNKHHCDINLSASSATINAKEETRDMYGAIDGAVDKLKRQLSKYHEKQNTHQSYHGQKRIRETKQAILE